jgi:hypothetical protein
LYCPLKKYKFIANKQNKKKLYPLKNVVLSVSNFTICGKKTDINKQLISADINSRSLMILGDLIIWE